MTTSRYLADQILRYKSLVAAEKVLLGLTELLPPGPRQRAEWLKISSNLAFRRFQLALVEYFAGEQKAGFNPQQPRVPAGILRVDRRTRSCEIGFAHKRQSEWETKLRAGFRLSLSLSSRGVSTSGATRA